MPDYKRFIAYFYEYIDGKRQRNAGFLKAEYRGGLWRLQLQLRAGRWPDEGLQIYGYVDEGKRCPLILLGKAYAQKENLTKRLQLEAGAMASAGLQFENLSGIWIPCDEQRCYISHWLEGEIQPERLSLKEEAPAAEEGRPEENRSEKKAILSKKNSAKGDATAEEQPEADWEEEQPEEQNSEEQIPAEQNAMEQNQTEQEPAEQIPAEQKPAEQKQAEQNTIEQNPAEQIPEEEGAGERKEEESAAEIYAEEIAEEAPAAEEAPEKKLTEMVRQEQQENQEQNAPEKNMEKEKAVGEASKNRQRDWIMLQKSHRSVEPFETEGLSCIRICPRDILWLKQRGWPVGRNSFLMQGFWQFRHLVLAQDTAGTFFLGVPGQENENSRSYATAFGFPEFRRGKPLPEWPGNFGYWCRRLEAEIPPDR